MKRKGITTICLTIILMASIFVGVLEPTKGSENDPIEIYDWHDLDEVRSWDNLNANYVLMNDLDKNTDGYNELVDTENGWNPLAYSYKAFQGTFDGQGNEIKNLYINRSGENPTGEDDDGLFRRSKGIIKNIGLVDVNVTGDKHVGGLVGKITGGTLSNTYVTGNVRGEKSVGGLVGWNTRGNISHSHVAVEVNGYADGENIGGLVGRNGGLVSNSYATGDVSGYQYVSGLAGQNNDLISNSYATGNISGENLVGGLVGKHLYGNITNTYATGDVNGSKNVGGLIGTLITPVSSGPSNNVSNSYSTGKVSGNVNVCGLIASGGNQRVLNCFWNTETSGINESECELACGTGKTTEEMKDVATFTDNSTEELKEPWDFVDNPNDDEGEDDLWDIDENTNDGYPFLTQKEENTFQLVINIEGEGTVEVDGEEVEDGEEQEYVEYTELTLEAVGDDSWEFDEWTGTDETGKEITITMDEYAEITAVFEEVGEDDDENGKDEGVGIPGFSLLLLLTAAIVAVALYDKNGKK
ncbi:MAG: GLUG motif-containing protein [Candidatus Saliniplasma sp.]